MKPADNNIEKQIKDLRTRASAELDKKMHSKFQQALDKEQITPAVHQPNVWRIIMQSRITKFVVAAVIIIATAVCVHYFNVSLDGTSVALAEVAEKVNQYDTLTHKERRLVTVAGEDEPWLTADVVKYARANYGVVEEQYDTDGNLLYRAYVLCREQGVIMLFPECKKFLLVSLNEVTLQRLSQITPQGLVNWFLSDEYTCLGHKEIDGRIAEGFEIINPTVFQELAKSSQGYFPIESSKMRLWIDVETKMPVLGESEVIVGKCLLTTFQKMHVKAKAYDLQWGIDIDPNIFDPNIPADYTPFNIMSTEE
jgi:hypothetical protein